MTKIIWSWPLLLVLAGGILWMVGMAKISNDNASIPYVIASIVVALVGTILYIQKKDKRDGKKYLRVKKKVS